MSSSKSNGGIAREGYPFFLIAAGLSLVVFLLGGRWVGLATLPLPLFVAWFFRDPVRVPPPDGRLIFSPADGKVLSVTEVEEGRYLRRRLCRISIFMSLFDVHVNRVPVAGRVKEVRYHPGRFLVGFAEKASLANEQNAVVIEGKEGEEVLFVQIAGWVARRIVCYLKGGEEVAAGDRMGLIRFGSRVDLYLPMDSEVLVKEGQRVRGGESPVGRFVS